MEGYASGYLLAVGGVSFHIVTPQVLLLQPTDIDSSYAHFQVFQLPRSALCYTPFDTQPILCGISMLLI